MAQRLVRRLCDSCKEPYEPLDAELAEIGLAGYKPKKGEVIYRAVGGPECLNSGYKGRQGIHELLQVEDSVRSLVMQNSPSSSIKKAAVSEGMKTLREDGAQKVLLGQTTIDEVMRVTAED